MGNSPFRPNFPPHPPFLKTLPLGFSACFEKYIVSALDIHDAVLEVESPLVPDAADFLVLAHDDVFCVEELFRVVVGHVVLGIERLVLHARNVLVVGGTVLWTLERISEKPS